MTYEYGRTPPSSAASKVLIVLGCAVVALLLIGGAGWGYFRWMRKQSNSVEFVALALSEEEANTMD